MLELEVTTVAHGGVFLARDQGRVVFVSDALPGERVRAEVTEDRHASFWRATTVEVLTASAHRREHIWPEASVQRALPVRVGGAEFGHIDLPYQRTLKAQVLRENLVRFGGLQKADAAALVGSVEALPGAPDGTGWRTRVRLHSDPDGAVGPYAARSHRVVPVDGLPLAVPEIAAAAKRLRASSVAESLDLIAPRGGQVHTLRTPLARADRATRGGRPARAAQSTRALRPTQAEHSSRAGTTTIMERAAGREFVVQLGGFWQVHTAAADILSQAVRDLVDADRFDPAAANLDLYGGVGLLAAALAGRFGATTAVTSVEGDAAAAGHARTNLAEWPNAAVVSARVDDFLGRLAATATGAERHRLRRSTVLLDPPRSGAGTRVVAQLAALRPAQILYVACDPVALSRDVGQFAQAGYALRTVRAWDLFPHTHHFETVALLSAD